MYTLSDNEEKYQSKYSYGSQIDGEKDKVERLFFLRLNPDRTLVDLLNFFPFIINFRMRIKINLYRVRTDLKSDHSFYRLRSVA